MADTHPVFSNAGGSALVLVTVMRAVVVRGGTAHFALLHLPQADVSRRAHPPGCVFPQPRGTAGKRALSAAACGTQQSLQPALARTRPIAIRAHCSSCTP